MLGFLRKSDEAKGRIGVAVARNGIAIALVSGLDHLFMSFESLAQAVQSGAVDPLGGQTRR